MSEAGVSQENGVEHTTVDSKVTDGDHDPQNTNTEDGEEDQPEEEDDEEEELDDEFDGEEDLTNKLNELRDMMGNIYLQQNQYSTIDIILNKTDFDLEELLEQDDFLPDLRRGKQNLMTYLAQTTVLEQLINYISTDVKEEDDPEPDKRKRFAHLAYEAIQTETMKEVVINNSDLLNKFFSFLDIPTEMDPLRCAYFSRIVELLFERYPKELVAYLRRRNCVVSKFVWHLNNQYIVESLFRLIDSQVSHQWLHDEDLIPLLMYKMAETEDPELQERTAATFVEILDLFVPFPYSILTTQMFHSEIVAQQWEQFTLSEAKNYDKIRNGLNVAVGILNLSFEGNMAEETPVFMTTVVKNLNFFLELLKNPQEPSKTFKMTYGNLTPPFGFLRVKILEFLSALLNTRYAAILEAFWKTDLFQILLDSLFFYRWNNTLHYYVDQIICTAMTLDNGEKVVTELLEKSKLMDRLIQAFDQDNPRTAGYMGQLTHIANELIKSGASHEVVGKALDARADWKAFVNGKLKDVNTVNNTPIAGGPVSST